MADDRDELIATLTAEGWEPANAPAWAWALQRNGARAGGRENGYEDIANPYRVGTVVDTMTTTFSVRLIVQWEDGSRSDVMAHSVKTGTGAGWRVVGEVA